MYEARSIAVCCWQASAPVNRSRFTCNANKYLQFTAQASSVKCVHHFTYFYSILESCILTNTFFFEKV